MLVICNRQKKQILPVCFQWNSQYYCSFDNQEDTLVGQTGKQHLEKLVLLAKLKEQTCPQNLSLLDDSE